MYVYTHLVIPNNKSLRQVQDSKNINAYTNTHTQSPSLSYIYSPHVSQMDGRMDSGNKMLTDFKRGTGQFCMLWPIDWETVR